MHKFAKNVNLMFKGLLICLRLFFIEVIKSKNNLFNKFDQNSFRIQKNPYFYYLQYVQLFYFLINLYNQYQLFHIVRTSKFVDYTISIVIAYLTRLMLDIER